MDESKKKFIEQLLKSIDSLEPQYLDELKIEIKGFTKKDMAILGQRFPLKNDRYLNLQVITLEVKKGVKIVHHFEN